MKRPVLIWASLGLGVALSACASHEAPHKKVEPKAAPIAVHAQSVSRVTQPLTDEVVGTVRARQEASISSSVMGTIRTLRVKLGSRVRAGDVLIQLAVGEIDAKAAQASANFAQAGVEMKRAQQLKATQSIPMAQYDAAAAQYRVAEAALAEAEAMRAYTIIRAPFAGIVTEKPANLGDLAVPGKPLLTLESPGALRLEAAIPEGLSHSLRQGEAMQVRFEAIEAPLDARVAELSPSADPQSRTVLVKFDLPNMAELRPGMFGRVRVHVGEESAVLVPSDAIVRQGQLETVYVVDGPKAHLRLIRTGRAEAGKTEVLSGLSGEEKVAVDQLASLTDEALVEVAP